jgi:predicted Zn-dependent protease
MSGQQLTTPNTDAGAEIYNLGRDPETPAQRVQRLQREARILAREQVEAIERDLLALAERAREIADGGEAYAIGIREMASRLAADLPQKAHGLRGVLDRSPRD